ncbi:MAG TPA: ankyrin repeat domain-containing protein [Candidatus Methylacidiphilales bacterium]
MIPATRIPDWMDQLGWVLIHFLWEGAAIGVFTWVALRALQKASSRLRYALLFSAMVACGLSPGVTWVVLHQDKRPHVNSVVISDFSSFKFAPAQTSSRLTSSISPPPSLPAKQALPSSAWRLEQIPHLIELVMPFLVALWGLGVMVLSLRLAYEWTQLQRFCAAGVSPKDQAWRGRLNILADHMGIHRAILLLESAVVEVPTVIGWLRPVILVPATFFTGLPPDQIEAILAHELAHIRRHDYLVNLGQIIIETVLFYHPVVWWISRALREEREHCCDDLAIQIIGDKAVYASALAALEESRSAPMAITLAATGGSLLERIRRLAGTKESPGSIRRRPLLTALIFMLALALGELGWTVINAITDARLVAALNQSSGWKSNDFKLEVDRSHRRINAAFDRQGKSLLDLAAEHGLENEALLLLLAGADPNLKDAAGKTAIYYTLDHPTYDQMMVRDLLLLRGARLDVTDRNGISPLMTAVKSADLKSIEALLRWGADRNPPQDEPLRNLARDRGDPKIIELLQSYVPGPTKAQLSQTAPSQAVQDAFVIAATKGDLEGMKTLLRQGATLDGRAADGVPAIHRAISFEQVDAVVYLLQLGADPNIRDDRSYPPLSYTFGWHGPASDYMRLALIAAGARTDLVQKSGYNLLADACSRDNHPAEQWMIWTGNDPSKACPAGTPMFLASKMGLDATIKLLQRNGVTEAPFSDPSPKWQMMRAVKAGDIPRIQQLLDQGVPVDLGLSDSKDSGLMVAIAYRQLEVARFLLKHGANPNYQNRAGATPLNITVGWLYPENEKFREELLDAGANPNLPDKRGLTPFICACIYGDLDPKITQMLAHGANINQRDHEGHSGLYYAERSGRTEAAAYLRQHGATEDPQANSTSTSSSESSDQKTGDAMPPKSIIIHIQQNDGSPLAGAIAKIEGPDLSANLTTGADGLATISLPAALPKYLSAHVHKDGFVPKLITWSLDQPSFSLPGDFILKMEKAQTIGGVVRNDAGEPVAGAKVVLIIRGSSMGGMAQQVFNDIWEQRVTTDEQGRWHFDEAPADLRSLQVTLEHPDYVSNDRSDPRPGDDEFKNQTALLTMHKGIPVDGTVTDEKGKPISGVDVAFGEAGSDSTTSPHTQTDEDGHFHFGGLSIKRSFGNTPILTFTSANYAPEMVDLAPLAGGRPLQVELKAGKPLRLRLTDPQGHPIKGVTLAADHWRGHRPFGCLSFQSDADGQIVWDHAPDDPITYAMLADSFQNQDLVLQPKAEVQTIQLKRPTVVSGKVLDAITRQPITNYDLIFGTYFPEKDPFWSSWARGAALHLKSDSFRYVFENRAVMGSPSASQPAIEGFHRIRIEAPGYEPGISRPIANDEESVPLDFQLKLAPAIHGVVTAADGSPVKNAQIVIAGPGNAVQIIDGVCRDKWEKQIITTNEQGEYDLPAQEADFPIVIVQPEAGYLTTAYGALKSSPNVKLLAWGELDISTTARKDAIGRYFIRYVDEDEAAAQNRRIRFQTYEPSESRDGLEIYRHLVAGALQIGQRGQGIAEEEVIQIENGAKKQFDWRTGPPAVLNPPVIPPTGSSPAMQTATLVVHVVNSEGKPVLGAEVKPIGLRSREEPGSYYFGSPSGKGIALQTGTTDAEGNATISFPAHPVDNLTTGTVAVLAQHPDACTANVELNIDAPRPVTLVRGTKWDFSVSPIPGVTFSQVYADIGGDRRQAAFLKWEHASDGQSVSAHFPDGKYFVRMVGVTAEGKVYFSDASSLTIPRVIDQHAENHTIGDNIAVVGDLTEVFQLKEGRSVRGKFDDTVPRPIKGGWVVADVTSPALDPNNWFAPTNGWETSADVAEDGSFVLTNLPAGTLEIMAGCEGYVAKDTSAKPIEGIRQAQVISEDKDQPVSVPMEHTGDARITVLTPDGKPLPGAMVFFNPNQMLGRGTNILGTRSSSLEMLRNRDSDPASLVKIRPVIPQFSTMTDANGVALVKGLAPGQQSFFVQSNAFDMPIQSDHPLSSPRQIWVPRRIGTLTVRAASEASAQIKMEPKGSTSLSAALQGADH